MTSRAEQKQELRDHRQATERADAAAQRKRTAYLVGGIGLIALIVVVALVLVSQAGNDNPAVDSGDLFGGVEQQGIALGSPDAPVTVVEFADLQCPFCAGFATNDLPSIIDRYVKGGDVRMELRLLSFIGPDSETGRLVAAAAAQQDRIWPFAENVYSNQEEENSGYMTADFLQQQAAGISGLDAAKAVADSRDDAAQQYATESDAEAQKAGVESTPSFLVGPTGGDFELVKGADDLDSKINEALAQAGQ